jgi:50S ribosomal protein L16 3-hydroxylase
MNANSRMTEPPAPELSAPDLHVRESLDWAEFVRDDWDRRPVLFKGVAHGRPFALDEVFRSALAATQRSRRRLPGEPDNSLVTLGRLQQLDPSPWMPRREDGSMGGYRERMLGTLGERRYALVISAFHGYRFALWRSEREFFAPLWRHAGLPITGAITTLFHGNYESTPVGVHRDRFATFMIPVEGRKRMRFWTAKPWADTVSTLPDYRGHLAGSFVVEAEPGDVLYWPADYYHVGESIGGGVTTSVNLGVPRTEHRPVYELEDLLVDIGRADALIDPSAQLLRALMRDNVPVNARDAIDADGVLADELPLALAQAWRLTAQLTDPRALATRIGAVSLQRLSAGGFEPVPPRRRARALTPAQRVALSSGEWVLQRRDRDGWQFAINGHGLRVQGDAAVERALLARLHDGEAARVSELLRGTVAQRRAVVALLDWVDQCHGLRRLRD